MTLSRRLARPMLSSIFIFGGLDAARRPDTKVAEAQKVLSSLPLPGEPATIVRANGALQIGAGLLLATGRLPRLASFALFASLLPTTLAGHRFWEERDPSTKAAQQVQFLKNVSLLGGLLIASVDTDGSPSLGHRARRRASPVGTVAGVVLPG